MTSSAVGGIRFGQYTLLRRIARGGMAEVFLAQQKGLEGFDRRVAVKRILPHLADAPDFVKMFLGEAKLAAQLTHPNVVHIYDFGKHDGDYFIAMEYVDGVHAGQLYKLAAETEKLPPALVARIGADAATALHYAHELRGGDGKPLGLVHRDVSPANIMVSFDGVVKLCDFGIAKAAALGEQLTNPGQVKGKYAYMSPEQTIAAPLDGRSDVFSLAIVLWELLAGRTIVGRGDAVEAMRAIRDGKLPSITSAAPKTPPALVKALTWAMQTRREVRATAMDFAQALEAFIKSSPELATPMQLAGWIRSRFPRDGASTGQHAAMPGVSVSTRASPGTLQARTPDDPHDAGTAVHSGTAAAPPTPPHGLIAASRPGALSAADLDSADTVALDDEDAKETLLDGKHTEIDPPRAPRPRNVTARPVPLPAHARSRTPTGLPRPRSASTEMTVPRDPMNPAHATPSSEHTAMAGGTSIIATELAGATALRPGTRGPDSTTERVQPAPAPTAGFPVLTERSPRATPLPGPFGDRGPLAQPARRRKATVIGALAGVAILSFAIALAAKSCGGGAPARRDAAAAIDARPAPRAPVLEPLPDEPRANRAADGASAGDAPTPALADAGPLDAPPPDAREPTIRPDAGAPPTSVLEVRTKPTGGTVRVSTLEEVRVDPARFALAPGSYTISAEFPGYLGETRDVVMERGVDVVQEIVFTRKKPGKAPPQTGKLTARTIPYSAVYLNGKLLGETPFAERALPVGAYTLTFKNPDKGSVTRKVKITANKTTKVSFTFP